MHNHPKGFLPIAVVLVAVVAALVVAGASYWYTKDKAEEVVNTNTAVLTNTNTVNENVNVAVNSNVNATNTNAAVNNNTNAANGTSKTYTSATRGISFTYAPTYADYKILVKETSSMLYVYTEDMKPEAGQFVQWFTKTASTPLKSAIEQQFLKGYSSADCFVITPDTYSASKMGSGWNTARIAYPPAAVNAENPWVGAEKCPKVYTASNGLSYFAEDKDDPTKFFFFSIGQYMIPAGSATVGEKGWEETVTIDPTVGWKTYTNMSYGYSIKYPADWILDIASISSGDLYILTKERQEKLDAKKMIRVMDIGVKVYTSASDLPNNSVKKLGFEDWIDQEADSYGFIKRKSITLDGVVGYQGVGSGDGASYLIFIQKSGRIYEIQTGDTQSPSQIEQLVINSFIFTE
ncbi:MAG: PsbP-related protein [Patescibacteria group bacterium]|jgi:hypothetical protein